jgi:hypothetical protein
MRPLALALALALAPLAAVATAPAVADAASPQKLKVPNRSRLNAGRRLLGQVGHDALHRRTSRYKVRNPRKITALAVGTSELSEIDFVTDADGAHFFAANYATYLPSTGGGSIFIGPFQADDNGTLVGAAPVVRSDGHVDVQALARETGVTVEPGREYTPEELYRAAGTISHAEVARGTEAVEAFYGDHVARGIHARAGAEAINAVIDSGAMDDVRLIRFTQTIPPGTVSRSTSIKTIDVLFFRDGASGVRLVAQRGGGKRGGLE